MANSSFNLADLNGSNGFIINGIGQADFLGRSVSGIGDFNGDGLPDLIVGADGVDFNIDQNTGASYVIFGSSEGFDTNFDLSDLNGSNGFVIEGNETLSFFGFSVSGAGDINGDGLADIIIGAPGAEVNNQAGVGKSYVVFGSNEPLNPRLNLGELDGSNGFMINGIDENDLSGFSVSDVGDINGDGFDDLIIGAYRANNFAGESYVVFGSNQPFNNSLNVAELDGSNGFVINGINPDELTGFSVSAAGDVNDDGFDDLIIGARDANFSDNDDNILIAAGRSYFIFGSANGFSSIFNLSELNGSNALAIENPTGAGERFGFSVSSVGDFNGDEIDDAIIGAPLADVDGNINAGESFIVFGSDSGFDANIFRIEGSEAEARSGYSVSGAGDINGDGLDDVIIGAPFTNNQTGKSYVVFGTSDDSNSSLNLDSLNGTNGFVIDDIDVSDLDGLSVSDAGDINGDGVDDLIIGARLADPNGIDRAGQSYVIFGNIAPQLDLNGNETGNDFTATFTGEPLSIVDNNFNLSDSNNTTLAGATVTITNLLNGRDESLSVDINNTDISSSYDVDTDAGIGILTLSGTDTIQSYQQVLQSLTYNNTATVRDPTERIVEFEVNDGEAHSNNSAIATTTITYSLPDLVVTSFNVNQHHVLGGETTVNFTIENQGNAAASAFAVKIVYSDDDIFGNEDDLDLQTIPYEDGLGIGDTLTGAEVAVSIENVNLLYNQAIIEDPAGEGIGYISNNLDYLGIIVDFDEKINESNEENNLAQGDITYFPWDVNGSGIVTPTDFIFILNRLGENVTEENKFADLNGDGSISGADALSVGDRFGYLINDAFEI